MIVFHFASSNIIMKNKNVNTLFLNIDSNIHTFLFNETTVHLIILRGLYN